MAPLTGIAFASNWLISKLNLESLSVKTTRMTTSEKCIHLEEAMTTGADKRSNRDGFLGNMIFCWIL